jgi:molybdopterin-guanine dinucleotide biosynthesis protein A
MQGLDKSLIQVQGTTARAHTCQILSGFVDRVFCSLPFDDNGDTEDLTSFHILKDLKEDQGPLGAFHAAYKKDPHSHWFVVACDFPFFDVKCASRLWLEKDSIQSFDAIGFHGPTEKFEPLLALWSSSALERAAQSIEGGTKSGPKDLLRPGFYTSLEPENPQWLFNANTRKDWQDSRNFLN